MSDSGQWAVVSRVTDMGWDGFDNGGRSGAGYGMHELGIATSILETVQKEAWRHPGARITKVGVKIGELAGVDVDALKFGFECIVKETEWERLVLDVEWIPRIQHCPKCGNEFRMAEFDPGCPKCGEFATKCISGEELDIAYMEVDE